MKIVMFYHSLVSDWNHGNAHFLRGVVGELLARGHEVDVYEPTDAWSRLNLVRDEGPAALRSFAEAYPALRSFQYSWNELDLDPILDDAALVIVHEWNKPELVAAIGRYRARHSHCRLLFHDTHHRCVTAADEMRRYELDYYDGVLAFGRVIRNMYLDRGWAARAWTWHEAADINVFYPRRQSLHAPSQQAVWIGNWGDEERSNEIRQYLIQPIEHLKLKARVFGVRYPQNALGELVNAGIPYGGWLANYAVPIVFANSQLTVHIPRRPYRNELPGVPTIRVFEALACGIPLVCLRWDDTEELFRPGEDYLVVDTPEQMQEAMRAALHDSRLARQLRCNGIQTIQSRHTCAHRVDELLHIAEQLGVASSSNTSPSVSRG